MFISEKESRLKTEKGRSRRNLHLTIRDNDTGAVLEDEDISFIMAGVCCKDVNELQSFIHGGDTPKRIVGACIMTDQAKEKVFDSSDMVQLGNMKHALAKVFPFGIEEDDDE